MQQDLLDQYAAEFKAHTQQRNRMKRPKQPGHAGPLVDVFLPAEVVDDMEAAINEAFEQITEEQGELDADAVS